MLDAGKKILGRKRHLLVDTLGLILHVVVHSAAIQDRDGAKLVRPILLQRFAGCAASLSMEERPGNSRPGAGNFCPAAACAWKSSSAATPTSTASNSCPAAGSSNAPIRFAQGRLFGWLSKFRRLSKDCEFRTENSEAIILIAAARLMLARLA